MSVFKKTGAYPQFNSNGSAISQLYGQSFLASTAGEKVDEWSALGISSVLGCVSLLADTLAAMRLREYQVIDGNRINVDLSPVLADPDPETNTFELIHQMVSSMALHGNSYSLLTLDKFGEAVGILPLHPYQMQVMPDKNQTARKYIHLGTTIPSQNMLHQRWFTPPQSLTGISPLNQSRQMLGLSIAMENYLAQFYGEGATPSGILTTPGKLSPEQATLIRDSWSSAHRKHRRVAVVSDNMKYEPVTVSAADQQMVQMREQLIRDVARIFRIPSHLILAQSDGQTYANVEQASLNLLIYTITPWMRRIEASLSRILPQGHYVEFDTSSLLRVDALTKSRVDKTNIEIGAKNPNEVRIENGDAPYDGGDVFNQSLMGKATAGGELPSLGDGPTPTIMNDGSLN